MNTLGTRLSTWLTGKLVGTDPEGNRYYTERRPRAGRRVRRWVIYAAPEPEASLVPPEWHAWLHYTTDEPIPLSERKPWQQPHQPNLPGPPGSSPPPAHESRAAHRPPAPGDYEAWTPGS